MLRYTISREILDRKYRSKLESELGQDLQNPGQLIKVEPTFNGAGFSFEHAFLGIEFLASDLVRLFWKPGLPPVPYAIAKTDWPGASIAISQIPEGWLLDGKVLKLLIKPNGDLQYLKTDGTILRHELAPQHRGHSEVSAWNSRACLKPDECIFGLGEQSGPLNLRGTRHRIWNTDPVGYHTGDDPIYMPLPVYLGLHQDGCYMVFYENSFPATFTFDPYSTRDPKSPDYATASFEKGMLQYYFIPGPPVQILERFTELTGRAGLPPLWSLGYHQCRWGYVNETDVRSVIKGFQENDLPLSAIHLDIDYMDGYRVFTVNEKRFPNLGDLARELKEQNIRLVTVINPGVKKNRNYPLYRNGIEEGMFSILPSGKPTIGVVWSGWSAFPDFTNPRVRAWWAKQYPILLESGIAGFWHDMNEPVCFDLLHCFTLPLTTKHELEGRGGDHQEAHNLYGLLMNRAGYEALREHQPERRPWILSRAGWVSQQRYAWGWTGDVHTSWDCLRTTIATVLGAGLSGQPYSGPDIGGFDGNPSAELYLRWLQLSTFLPFFRTHSSLGTARREPWVYGEPYTSIIRQFLRLRYRMLPYLYTLAWQANQYGYPLVRPLFWAEPENRELWKVDDSFLLGDELLVAPILGDMKRRRRIILPRGTWFNLWDDTTYTGPGSEDIESHLETIPVLVRAGSILPMVEGDRLSLHVYPEENEFNHAITQLLYSDSGDGYGDWRLDRLYLRQKDHTLEISRESEGEYPFPYHLIELHLHGIQAKEACVDDRAITISENLIQTNIFQKILIKV